MGAEAYYKRKLDEQLKKEETDREKKRQEALEKFKAEEEAKQKARGADRAAMQSRTTWQNISFSVKKEIVKKIWPHAMFGESRAKYEELELEFIRGMTRRISSGEFEKAENKEEVVKKVLDDILKAHNKS